MVFKKIVDKRKKEQESERGGRVKGGKEREGGRDILLNLRF